MYKKKPYRDIDQIMTTFISSFSLTLLTRLAINKTLEKLLPILADHFGEERDEIVLI